jgi:hypothetical protein
MKNVLVALATEQCAAVPVKVRQGLTTPNRRRSNLLRKVSENARRETGDSIMTALMKYLAVLRLAGALSLAATSLFAQNRSGSACGVSQCY